LLCTVIPPSRRSSTVEIVLASCDGDVDPERARGLEHAYLGRLAARPPCGLGGELGRRAGGDRAAEESEHRVSVDRRLDVDVRFEVELAERRPDPDGAHSVVGQSPRLVRADDGCRAERLDGTQAFDERATTGEARNSDGERERQCWQETLRDVGDDQPNRKCESVLQRQTGNEPADRHERQAGGHGNQGDQPGNFPDLLLERTLLHPDSLRESRDPAELRLHAGGENDRLALSSDARAAAEDELARFYERPGRVLELGRAKDGL
jgi:hypothetical protein